MVLYKSYTVNNTNSNETLTVLGSARNCHEVTNVPPKERCNFIKTTLSCEDNDNVINYIQFIYCGIETTNDVGYGLAVSLMFLVMLYAFAVSGITADVFFCPSLTVVSKMLKLSEDLAGITLVAFGNGSPDIFTSVANRNRSTELIYAEHLGAALFVIGIVSSLLMIIKPFKPSQAPLVRDTFFFLFVIMVFDNVMDNNDVTLAESISLFIIYVAYIAVVIIDQILVNREAAIATREFQMSNLEDRDKLASILSDLYAQTTLNLIDKRSRAELDFVSNLSADFVDEGPNTNIFSQFRRSLSPIDKTEWSKSTGFNKAVIIFKAPIIFVLQFFVPIVDYNVNIHGWSKILNIIHINTIPILFITTNNFYKAKLFNISIFVYTGIVTLILSVIVFFTSRTSTPPKYHILFAIAAIISSISIIAFFAREIVSIFNALGVISGLTPSFLGSTLLAWGNSVGDLIANVALAHQGYHRMGYTACFGGPMFNTVIGLGLVLLLRAIASPTGSAPAIQGAMGYNCTVFLLFMLTLNLVAMSLTNFAARRSIAAYLIIIYLIFLAFVILGEYHIIRAYGPDA